MATALHVYGNTLEHRSTSGELTNMSIIVALFCPILHTRHVMTLSGTSFCK